MVRPRSLALIARSINCIFCCPGDQSGLEAISEQSAASSIPQKTACCTCNALTQFFALFLPLHFGNDNICQLYCCPSRASGMLIPSPPGISPGENSKEFSSRSSYILGDTGMQQVSFVQVAAAAASVTSKQARTFSHRTCLGARSSAHASVMFIPRHQEYDATEGAGGKKVLRHFRLYCCTYAASISQCVGGYEEEAISPCRSIETRR